MKPLLTSVGMLLGLTAIGTVGLRLIEAAPWLDCLFMAVISLTTVGYGEIVPLSSTGRWFMMAYLFAGLGVFTYAATRIGQWIVSAEMREYWEGRRMENRLRQLRNHYIVCGLGRMGSTIANYLHERGQSFVVVDHNAERLHSHCDSRGWLYLIGDATNDDVLRHAGIERAHALTTVLSTDADNVYVVLTARMLNSKLPIVARASDDKAVQKCSTPEQRASSVHSAPELSRWLVSCCIPALKTFWKSLTKAASIWNLPTCSFTRRRATSANGCPTPIFARKGSWFSESAALTVSV